MDGTIPPKTSARSAQLRRPVGGPSTAPKILPLSQGTALSQASRAARLPGSGGPMGLDDGLAKDRVGEMSAVGCDVNRERALVRRACRGETSAMGVLYRTYYESIFRYVFFRLRSTVATEDVTHQVFLGMCQGLSRYRDEGRPFVAWLYGIAKKQVAYHQKGQRRAPPVQPESGQELIVETAGPHATLEGRERRLAIAEALHFIPARQREAIILRYILSLSLAETAATLGRSEGAVKQLQLRGLSSLRNSLDFAKGSRSLWSLTD